MSGVENMSQVENCLLCNLRSGNPGIWGRKQQRMALDTLAATLVHIARHSEHKQSFGQSVSQCAGCVCGCSGHIGEVEAAFG